MLPTPTEPLPIPIVLAAVQAQFPHLNAKNAVLLGAGWDSRAYLVDETWVFRFPQRPGIVDWMRQEAVLLDVLAPRLDLPVPRHELRGEPCEGIPLPFAGYRYLPGHQSVYRDPSEWRTPERLKTLARALAQVHAVPWADVAHVPWVEARPAYEAAARFQESAAKFLPTLRDRMPSAVFARMEQFFDRLTDADLTPGPHACPLHHDLNAEHVLVNPESRALCGLIDWGDAAFADPAREFYAAWQYMDSATVHSLFGFYRDELAALDAAHLADDRLLARSLAITRAEIPRIFAGGIALDRREDEIICEQWVRNVFGDDTAPGDA